MSEGIACRIEGCNRKGATIHNRLCNPHWEELIEKNLKQFIKDTRSVQT